MILRLFKLAFAIITVMALIVALTACRQQEKKKNTQEPILSTTQAKTTQATTAVTTATLSDNGEIPDIDTYIILDDEKTTINGGGATFENNVLTITDGGAYHLEGSLTDGKIYVSSANETKKVKLVLSGVSISCGSDAPLYVENSPDETVLILKNGTQNYFSDTARTVAEGVTDYATAAIYSKDDLQIEGSGSLTVNGNFNKGIFSKNDIDIHGGNIVINAVDDGIRGKDSVEIESGTITITCGGDGIRTSEELEEDKGFIEINGGTLNITSALDAIQATGSVTVNGGFINAESGGGATDDYSYTYNYGGDRGGMFPFMSGRHPDSSMYEEATVNTPSTKGIKAERSITVNGGLITLNCLDDSIHSPVVTLNGGEITASSDDDGIHADETVTVRDGKVDIISSYEGVEGRTINIGGGELIITSSDDGFNAAGDSTQSQTSQQSRSFGMMPGGPGGMMDYDESCIINMTGGFVLINAWGDGIDSNGSVNMSDGKMVVFGPTSGGNGALDYGGSFTVSGGTLFASGALGMAQSVTGNGVQVVNFNVNGNADTVYALTDSAMNCKIAFTAPKNFQNIVFASDTLDSSSYSFYKDGTVSADSEKFSGICFGGVYSPGTLLGTLR